MGAESRVIGLTASLVPGNLTSNGKLLALASHAHVAILAENKAGAAVATLDALNDATVMQCSWCQFGDGASYLVLALRTGVQVWGADGKRMFLWQPLPPLIAKEAAAAAPDPDQHAIGIASLTTSSATFLCVGTSVGTVLVFSHDVAQLKFTHTKSVRTGPAEQAEPPVTALATSSLADGAALLARADSTGGVQLWTTKNGSTFDMGKRLAADGLCCTGLCAREHILAASYSNGELRLYSATSGSMLLQVAAHARWITALTLHPSAWLIAAASEDAHVSIWAVSVAGEDISAKNLAFWGVPDAHLCGVAFHGEGGKSVSAAAYDSNVLTTWALP
mmetsp:Transcript_15439/g.39164  ORF Transcript_15439/g.39164 Transcript_15439/m.39164 type:complete len:334 (+) Transcript_15439:75-1076(+)